MLAAEGIKAWVVNARFAKPIDKALLSEIAVFGGPGGDRGGEHGQGRVWQRGGRDARWSGALARLWSMLGLPDKFVGHGRRVDLLEEVGLTREGIARGRQAPARRSAGDDMVKTCRSDSEPKEAGYRCDPDGLLDVARLEEVSRRWSGTTLRAWCPRPRLRPLERGGRTRATWSLPWEATVPCLRAARAVGGRMTPVLGVNVGSLGFLTEVTVEEMDEALDGILAGKYAYEDRMNLDASVVRDRQGDRDLQRPQRHRDKQGRAGARD